MRTILLSFAASGKLGAFPNLPRPAAACGL